MCTFTPEKPTARHYYSIEKPPTLLQILNDPELCRYFHDCLEASVCHETLLFWKEAEDFKHNSTQETRKKTLMAIVKKFLVDGAEYEMDFADARRRELLECMDNPGPDALENIKWDVYTTMSRDSLPRFLNSRWFKEYLFQQPDDEPTAFSRKKLQDFFGEEITGPLKRCNLIDRISVSTKALTAKQRKRLRAKYGPELQKLGVVNLGALDPLAMRVGRHK